MEIKTLSKKEKNIQIALGTLNIPELVPIDLSKINKTTNTHPDLETDEFYLVLVDGCFHGGFLDLDDVFTVNHFRQNLTECKGIWLIKER